MSSLLNKFWLVAVSSVFIATSVLAQDDFGLYDTAKKALPTGTPNPVAIIATVIQIILSVIGVVAVILILYASFQWMTAAGNEEKISSAKKIMAGAVVGLALIFSSYIIANFVFNSISQSITPGPAAVAVECNFSYECGAGMTCNSEKKCEAVVAPCAGACLDFGFGSSSGACTLAEVGSESCPAGQGCYKPTNFGDVCPPPP